MSMEKNEYYVYSQEILLNSEEFSGMKRDEMEIHIFKIFHDIDFSVFKIEVDVLDLSNPKIKNMIKVRVFRRIKRSIC